MISGIKPPERDLSPQHLTVYRAQSLMFWIKTIPFTAATGKLKTLYERVVGPSGNLDNILQVHALRPHTLQGHMTLYKNVLHHTGNTVPKWFLETLGVYVSWLNDCSYCVEHHFAGLRRLLSDDARANKLRRAIETENFDDALEPRFASAMLYAKILTRDPARLDESVVQSMRNAGLDDGEILEVNQVVAYFCYANRTVLGLGVSIQGDVLGLSPNSSSEPDNWNHS